VLVYILTKIYGGIVGSYPRPVTLARLLNKFYSNKISLDRLEHGYEEHMERLFRLLIKFGIEYITDGMFRWDDIFNPLISYIDGVRIDGLYRFYDNNFFFRAPHIVARIRLRGDVPIAMWYSNAMKILDRVVAELGIENIYVLKPVLPGPLTFALNSVNEFYSDLRDLINDYTTEVLSPLIKSLSSHGATVVEIHEPEIVVGRADKVYISEAVNSLASLGKEHGVRLWIQTYFGDIGRFLGLLVELQSHIIGIDLTATKNFDSITKGLDGFRHIALGLYNSRSTIIEKNTVLRGIVQMFTRVDIDDIYVTNSAPMDFIPEVIAVRKLRKLGLLVKSLRDGET